jgi:competence protein ComEA
MISDKLREIFETRRAEVWGMLVAVLVLGMGIFWWRMEKEPEMKIEVIKATVTEEAGNSSQSGELIMVDVAGAVKQSGVYKVTKETRVGEVLELAGGLATNADVEWVERYINRSEKIRDGMKIYIPRAGEQESIRAGVVGDAEMEKDARIDINKASQAELEELPGIGPVTAGKIIAGRPYSRIEELTEKKIVNTKVWGQIRERIVAW